MVRRWYPLRVFGVYGVNMLGQVSLLGTPHQYVRPLLIGLLLSELEK